MEWYLIETMNQRERTVKERIERMTRQGGVDGIGEVLVPTQTTGRNGRSGTTAKDNPAYPGYVFIQMDMTDERWMEIRRVLDVKGFVSHENPDTGRDEPAALSEREMEQYLTPIEAGNIGWSFAIGESVRITSGPMEDIVGYVTDIGHSGKATVEINVFGRMTPVEVEASGLARV